MLSWAREDNWNYTSDANGQAADDDDRVPLPLMVSHDAQQSNQILRRLKQSWRQKKALVLEVFYGIQ
jgi:hypothetical protein